MSIAFSEFCEIYIASYARPHKRSWRLDEARCRKYLIPEWKNKKLCEVRRSDVALLHAQIGSTKPYAANRIREQVSKMFELAVLWEYLPEAHPNPARGIKEFRERPREDILRPHETRALSAAIEVEPDIYIRAAIWLIFLLGRRKSEILQLRWENVDLDRAFIRLPETKSGKTVLIPISPQSVAVFKAIPKRNEFVIPGDGDKHRNTIQKAWERIRTRAKLEHLRVHDLRRTAAAWMATDGTSLHIIGEVLGHASPTVTANYSKLADQALRNALTAHGTKLSAFLKTSFDSLPADSQLAVDETDNDHEMNAPLPIEDPGSKDHHLKTLTEVEQIIVEAKILASIRGGGCVKKQFYRKIGGTIKVSSLEMNRVLAELVARGIIKRRREAGRQARHWRYEIA